MNSILIERTYLGLGRYFSRVNRRNPLAKNIPTLGRDRDNLGYLTKASLYLHGSSSRPAGAELIRSPNRKASFRQRNLNRRRQAPLDES
jgi:hypothetical protein